MSIASNLVGRELDRGRGPNGKFPADPNYRASKSGRGSGSDCSGSPIWGDGRGQQPQKVAAIARAVPKILDCPKEKVKQTIAA